MITVRCTKRLLTRLNVAPATEEHAPTSRLGDWYANVFYVGKSPFVVFVSERSLLPVSVRAAPSATLVTRFVEATDTMLRAIQIADAHVEHERLAMEQWVIGRTKSRQVLGSMNDFINLLDAYLRSASCAEASLHAAESPSSPIGMDSPIKRTREIFARPLLRLV